MPYGIRTITCAKCGKVVTGRFPETQKFCSLQCFTQSRKTTVIRLCNTCGKAFEYCPSPAREAKGSGKYCSQKCKYIGMRTGDHPCPNCGKVIGSQQRHCSRQCGQEARSRKRRTGHDVPCEICEKTFYLPLTRLHNAKHHFCCMEHLNEWQGRNKVAFTCKICGKSFKWSPSRIGVIYCSIACRDKDPERSEMLRELNLKQQTLKPNSLETFAYGLLDSIGIAYERQHMIGGKFCVDAFVPSTNTVVQFDGDYWHGNPDKFPVLDKRQQHRIRIDQSQNAYFAKCGYKVLRFWETDIRKRPEWMEEQMRHAIQSPAA